MKKKVSLICTFLTLFFILNLNVNGANEIKRNLIYDVESMIINNDIITIEGWAYVQYNNTYGIGTNKNIKVHIYAVDGDDGSIIAKSKDVYVNSNNNNYLDTYILQCERKGSPDYTCVEGYSRATCENYVSNNAYKLESGSSCQYYNTRFKTEIDMQTIVQSNAKKITFKIFAEYKENNKENGKKNKSSQYNLQTNVDYLRAYKGNIKCDDLENNNACLNYEGSGYKITNLNTSKNFKVLSAGAKYQTKEGVKKEGDETFGNSSYEIKKYVIPETIEKRYLKGKCTFKLNCREFGGYSLYKLKKPMGLYGLKVGNTIHYAFASWGKVDGKIELEIEKSVTYNPKNPVINSCRYVSDNTQEEGCQNTTIEWDCKDKNSDNKGYQTIIKSIKMNENLSDSGCQNSRYYFYKDVYFKHKIEYTISNDLEKKPIYNGGGFELEVKYKHSVHYEFGQREEFFIQTYTKNTDEDCVASYIIFKKDDINTNYIKADVLSAFGGKEKLMEELTSTINDNISSSNGPTTTSVFPDSNNVDSNKKNNSDDTDSALLDGESKGNNPLNLEYVFKLKYAFINKNNSLVEYRENNIVDNDFLGPKQFYYVPINYTSKNKIELDNKEYYEFPIKITINNAPLKVHPKIEIDLREFNFSCKIPTYPKYIPGEPEKPTYLINYRVVDLNKMFPNILPYGFTDGDTKYGANWYKWISTKYNSENTKDEVNGNLSSWFADNNNLEYTVKLNKTNLETILSENNKLYSQIAMGIDGSSNLITSKNLIFTRENNLKYSRLGESGKD